MNDLEIGNLAKAVSPLRSATAVQILTPFGYFTVERGLGILGRLSK